MFNFRKYTYIFKKIKRRSYPKLKWHLNILYIKHTRNNVRNTCADYTVVRKVVSVIYCPDYIDKHVIFIEDLSYDRQRVVSRKNIGICYLQVFDIDSTHKL